MLRKAMFAGSFYDSSPTRLRHEIDQWFERAVIPDTNGTVSGVISPHAGYMYSGPCAAHSYKLLKQKEFETAIIIHPSHRGNHFTFSVAPYDEYETPLGNLNTDSTLNKRLFEQGAEIIDAWYHQNEHSMEVQLPFLKQINPACRVVPLMVGNQTHATANRLAEMLSGVLDAKTVLIVSTDLSHYYTADEAELKDSLLIEQVKALKPDELFTNIRSGMVEACGFTGILTLMHLAQKTAGASIIELNYTHSGHTSGDMSQVVGYLSAALVKGK